MKQDIEIKIEKIAKDVLKIPTLDKRHSDNLDFYDRAVWRIKEALVKAYEKGREDAIEDVFSWEWHIK